MGSEMEVASCITAWQSSPQLHSQFFLDAPTKFRLQPIDFLVGERPLHRSVIDSVTNTLQADTHHLLLRFIGGLANTELIPTHSHVQDACDNW